MDPEGTHLLTYSTIGLRQAPPVHKYSSLRSTAHRAAAGRCVAAARLVKVQCQVSNR